MRERSTHVKGGVNSIKIKIMINAGGVDLVLAIVQLEERIGTLERAYDFLLNSNYSLRKPTQSDIEKFRSEAISDLQKKYPELGITKK